jgi:hypothetical protein
MAVLVGLDIIPGGISVHALDILRGHAYQPLVTVHGYSQYVKNQSQQYLNKHVTAGAVEYKYSRKDALVHRYLTRFSSRGSPDQTADRAVP